MPDDNFRSLTEQERKLLKTYYQSMGQDEDRAHEILEKYWFTAIDGSNMNPPVYTGTVIVAVYGMIEFYELFHVEHNTIKHVEMYDLNLKQSMQLTSILHSAITLYMRKLGFMGKPRRKQGK